MKTRMGVQDQLNHFMEKAGGPGGNDVLVPDSQLLLVLFGELADEKHEVCQKLCQNLNRRYKNQEAYQVLYSPANSCGNLKETLYDIRRNVEKGFLKRTVNYYIPMVFLMADSRLDALADTVVQLKKELASNGVLDYHVDLYGLIAGNIALEGENWKKYKDKICSSDLEAHDLYLLSGDELVNSNIFGRALHAIEMNIFLKVHKGLAGSHTWEVPSNLTEGIGKPYEFWKSLSYWRMDLTSCVLCHYLRSLVDKQLTALDLGFYEAEINGKIDRFFKDQIESKALDRYAMQIPVRKEDLEEVLNTAGGIFGFLGKNPSDSYTFKEAITKLYGGEEYFARFAESALNGLNDDKAKWADQLFALGALENFEMDFLPAIKKRIAGLDDEIESLKCQVINKGRESLGAKIHDFERFLQRLYSTDAYGKKLYDLYCKTKEKELLEDVEKQYHSEGAKRQREEQRTNKNNLKLYFNQIIEDNMPSNGWEIQSMMSEYPFYPGATDTVIGWQEDIFQYVEKEGIHKILKEILNFITDFIQKERNSVIRIFLEGIQKQRDFRSADPLYMIRGASYCQERNRREFLLGNFLFMNSKIVQDQNKGLVFEKIKMISCNTCFPFTLEFFGINDSATTRGIKGL